MMWVASLCARTAFLHIAFIVEVSPVAIWIVGAGGERAALAVGSLRGNKLPGWIPADPANSASCLPAGSSVRIIDRLEAKQCAVNLLREHVQQSVRTLANVADALSEIRQ